MNEMERRALEEERRTSPRYARYRFLRGFKVFLLGRRVVYGLEWVTLSLPVLYRGEGEDEGSCSGRRGWCSGPPSCPCWERQALDPGAGGEGDFKYVDLERFEFLVNQLCHLVGARLDVRAG